jgi:hypothetical protein
VGRVSRARRGVCRPINHSPFSGAMGISGSLRGQTAGKIGIPNDFAATFVPSLGSEGCADSRRSVRDPTTGTFLQDRPRVSDSTVLTHRPAIPQAPLGSAGRGCILVMRARALFACRHEGCALCQARRWGGCSLSEVKPRPSWGARMRRSEVSSIRHIAYGHRHERSTPMISMAVQL